MDSNKIAYTVPEALKAIGIGRTNFYKLASEGKIDLRTVGGRTLVPAASLKALVDGAPTTILRTRRRNPSDKERLPEILELVEAGLSYSEISKRVGLSRSQCFKLAHGAGVRRGGAHHLQTNWTDETHAVLIGMSQAGLSSTIIAKRLGIGRQAVIKERRRLGISMRGKRLVRSDGRKMLI